MDLPFLPSLTTLLHHHRWTDASSRLSTHLGIRQACTATPDGTFPLHHALHRGAPSTLILTLLRIYPRAASVVDGDGLLPLHKLFVGVRPRACLDGTTAAESGCSRSRTAMVSYVQVVDGLLQTYPQGARIPTEEGRCLALHLACKNLSSTDNTKSEAVQVIQLLLQAYPEATQVRNRYGRLPLHVACWIYRSRAHHSHTLEHDDTTTTTTSTSNCKNPPVVVQAVSALLQTYPPSARIPTPAGNLPLHLVLTSADAAGGAVACRTNACIVAGLCQVLLGVYPEAASVPDRNGNKWSQRWVLQRWWCFAGEEQEEENEEEVA